MNNNTKVKRRKGRTHEEFVSIVKKRYGDEYRILSRYTTKRNKVRVLHRECDNEYETVAGNLTREGRGKCPHCKSAWNKWSHERFETELIKRRETEYSLLSKYKTANQDVKIKHNKCGYIWWVKAKNILSVSGCPECGHAQAMEKQALTPESYKSRINDRYKGEYTLLSKYRRMSHHVQIKHNECGHIFSKSAADVLAGCMCPVCKEKETMTADRYRKTVHELTNGDYSVLGEYVNTKTKIGIKHNKCGYYWEMAPGGFLSGNRCPRCAGNFKLNTKEFAERVDSLTNNEYELIGEYVKSIEKVQMKHKKCGTLFEITPNQFTNGGRCPSCSRSLGELKVESFLKINKIDFQPQYRFNDCRNKKPLPFDFALFEEEELLCLVEYHGKQHYEPIDYFGGEKEYRKRVKLDGIKEKYCEQNKIPLIVIPYYEEGTENYLKKELNKLKTLV